jgi:hypothetical protein
MAADAAVQQLEPRYCVNTLLSPGGTTLAFFTPDADGFFNLDAQPTTPQSVPDLYYDQPTADGNNGASSSFIAQWKGTFNSDTAGTYRFSLDHADGAILVIDPGTDHAQVALYALSLPGDTDMDGSTTVYDQIQIFGSGYYNDGRTDHTWTDGDLNGDGAVNFLDISQVMGYEGSAVVAARTITANTNDMVDSGYLTDGVNLTAGSHTFELDVFQRGGESNTFAQLSVSNPDTPTTFYSVDSKAPVVAAQPIAAVAGQEFDGVVATFTQSTHRTTGESYTSQINWGDGSSPEPGEIFDNGDGTLGLWATHTYAMAGTYTPHVKVTHTASTLYGEADGSASVVDPAPPVVPTVPDAPTGLAAHLIYPTTVGLVWDRVPGATSYMLTRTGGAGGAATYTVSDPSNGFVDDNVVPHTSYSYTVKARNDAGDSGDSDAATISTTSFPLTVQDLGTTSFASGSVEVTQNSARFIPVSVFGVPSTPLDESSLAGASHGTLSIANDPTTGVRSVRYTPAAGYLGRDSFTYTVGDGVDHSQRATADIIVVPDEVPAAPSFIGNLTYYGPDPATAHAYLQGAGFGLRAVLVSAPSSVSLVNDQTGEISVTGTPAQGGGYEPVQIVYKLTDGLSDGNPGTARFDFPHETTLSYGGSYTAAQGASVQVPAPDPSGAAVEVIEPPQHGTFSQQANGSYVYAPAIGFVGRDWVTYKFTDGGTTDPNGPFDNLYHTISFGVNAAEPAILAHRTEVNSWSPVLEDVRRSADPSKYVILTNNGHIENHADGSADNTDSSAWIPPGSSHGSLPESDLARIDLSTAAPSSGGASTGTLELQLSDPTAVRLLVQDFTQSGGIATEVYAPGHSEGQNLVVDLAHEEESPLLSAGGQIWLEGLKACPDLRVSWIYRNANGQEVARDELHMDILDASFVDKNGAQVSFPQTTTLNQLVAASEASTGMTIPDESLFKLRLDGLAPGLDRTVTAVSSANPADSYTDTIGADGLAQSFASLYTSWHSGTTPSEVLSAGQRSNVLANLGIKAVAGLGANFIFATLLDQLEARQQDAQLTITQDDPYMDKYATTLNRPSPGAIARPIYDESQDVVIALGGLPGTPVNWNIAGADYSGSHSASTIIQLVSQPNLVGGNKVLIQPNGQGDVEVKATVTVAGQARVFRQTIHVALTDPHPKGDLNVAPANRDAFLQQDEAVKDIQGVTWSTMAALSQEKMLFNFGVQEYNPLKGHQLVDANKKPIESEIKAMTTELVSLENSRIMYVGQNAPMNKSGLMAVTLAPLGVDPTKANGQYPALPFGVVISDLAFGFDRQELDFTIEHERNQARRMSQISAGQHPLALVLGGYLKNFGPKAAQQVNALWDYPEIVPLDLARLAQNGVGTKASWRYLEPFISRFVQDYNSVITRGPDSAGSLKNIDKLEKSGDLPTGSYKSAFEFAQKLYSDIAKAGWSDQLLMNNNPGGFDRIIDPAGTEANLRRP